MIRITRKVTIPDHLRLERYSRSPDLGPSVLFFSGGTALRETSKAIIRYTHNSIHLITPFDSGGSSAELRNAFGMPAVGDIRNRLMALADQSVKGNPEIFALFTHRLSKQSTQEELRKELARMAAGEHTLVRWVHDPMRTIIRTQFRTFIEAMPDDFDLRGASIGNIMLTAGYLDNRRQLDPVIYIFSKLVRVCGLVRPTVNQDLHLAVRLENGRIVIGQHLMTGKETGPLESPIESVWLTDSLESEKPVVPSIRSKVAERIAGADLICYPIGSFYSSVVANLLPQGVGEAIAANPGPKVFVPNTTEDPEARGVSVAERARIISDTLAANGVADKRDGLEFILLDAENATYDGGIDREGIERLDLTIVDCHLVTPESSPLIDGRLLSEALLSMT